MKARNILQAAEATAVNQSGTSALRNLVSATQQKYKSVGGCAVSQQLLTSLVLLVFMPASVQTFLHIPLSQAITPTTPSLVGSKFLLKVSFRTQSFAIAINSSPFRRCGHLCGGCGLWLVLMELRQ